MYHSPASEIFTHKMTLQCNLHKKQHQSVISSVIFSVILSVIFMEMWIYVGFYVKAVILSGYPSQFRENAFFSTNEELIKEA